MAAVGGIMAAMGGIGHIGTLQARTISIASRGITLAGIILDTATARRASLHKKHNSAEMP